jgi:hypothetical protein
MLFRGVVLSELVEISRIANQNRWDELDSADRELRDFDVLFTLADTGAVIVQDNDAGELLLGRLTVRPTTLPGVPDIIHAHDVLPDNVCLRLWAGRELCQGVILYDRVRRLAYTRNLTTLILEAREDVEMQQLATHSAPLQAPRSTQPAASPRAARSRKCGSY